MAEGRCYMFMVVHTSSAAWTSTGIRSKDMRENCRLVCWHLDTVLHRNFLSLVVFWIVSLRICRCWKNSHPRRSF